MQIAKNTVAAIDYKLCDDDGQVIDTNEGGGPLFYLHGVGEIIPGLEKELEGKSAGDEINCVIPPEEGYGNRNPELIQSVGRENFEDADSLELGMQFQTPEEEGGLLFSICEINGEEIIVDANHELAGMNLHFNVTVKEVREASDEEIDHGHAHDPNGHHH